MSNPFRIEGPAAISFSGGRTSGLMLSRVIEAHGGRLPDDVHVLFANTGKEREETLEFVHAIETRWCVRIHWNEYRAPQRCDCLPDPLPADFDAKTWKHAEACAVNAPSWKEVDFESASRAGEPFVQLIRNRNFLPNPVMRFCTQELKIRVMRDWLQARGYEHWTNVVGLRADEPHRVARMHATNAAGKERWEVAMPLAEAGVTKADVDAFWKAQPFDLRLSPWEGNCDLCFLKGRNRKLRVIRDRPELAAWWIEMESLLLGKGKPGDARFRHDAPSYARMLEMVRSQPLLPGLEEGDPDDTSIDCFCTN